MVKNRLCRSNPVLKLFNVFASFTITGRSFQSGIVLFMKKFSLILSMKAHSFFFRLHYLPVHHYSLVLSSLAYFSILLYPVHLKSNRIQFNTLFFFWFQELLVLVFLFSHRSFSFWCSGRVLLHYAENFLRLFSDKGSKQEQNYLDVTWLKINLTNSASKYLKLFLCWAIIAFATIIA